MIVFYSVLNTVENAAEKQQLEALFNRYEKKIYKYILARYRLSKEDTEDMTAQTFFLMVKYKQKFIGSSESRQISLLISFARCSCINLQKRKAVEARHSICLKTSKDDEIFGETEPTDPIDFTEELAQHDYEQLCTDKARELIARMSSPAREILLMKTETDLNSSEISALLEIPPATVRTIVRRAFIQIRKELQHDKTI